MECIYLPFLHELEMKRKEGKILNALSLDCVFIFCGIPYVGIEKFECREIVNEHTYIHPYKTTALI